MNYIITSEQLKEIRDMPEGCEMDVIFHGEEFESEEMGMTKEGEVYIEFYGETRFPNPSFKLTPIKEEPKEEKTKKTKDNKEKTFKERVDLKAVAFKQLEECAKE